MPSPVDSTIDLELLRTAVAAGKIYWRQHALERLLERNISRSQVSAAILSGEVIEAYTTDKPFPSCLILGLAPDPLHVVAAVDPDAGTCHVISAYRPDLEHFELDLKTRRRTR